MVTRLTRIHTPTHKHATEHAKQQKEVTHTRMHTHTQTNHTRAHTHTHVRTCTIAYTCYNPPVYYSAPASAHIHKHARTRTPRTHMHTHRKDHVETLVVETSSNGVLNLDTLLVHGNGLLDSLMKQLCRQVVVRLETVQKQVLRVESAEKQSGCTIKCSFAVSFFFFFHWCIGQYIRVRPMKC